MKPSNCILPPESDTNTTNDPKLQELQELTKLNNEDEKSNKSNKIKYEPFQNNTNKNKPLTTENSTIFQSQYQFPSQLQLQSNNRKSKTYGEYSTLTITQRLLVSVCMLWYFAMFMWMFLYFSDIWSRLVVFIKTTIGLCVIISIIVGNRRCLWEPIYFIRKTLCIARRIFNLCKRSESESESENDTNINTEIKKYRKCCNNHKNFGSCFKKIRFKRIVSYLSLGIIGIGGGVVSGGTSEDVFGLEEICVSGSSETNENENEDEETKSSKLHNI